MSVRENVSALAQLIIRGNGLITFIFRLDAGFVEISVLADNSEVES
jgi:hypothetical protein